MMPHEPVRDIMRRTMQNLEFIEKHAEPNGPYEVTQLLNSFLGALAHPWETYRDDLAPMSLDAARDAGWPKIVKESPRDRDPDSLGDLIRLMRNAVAHGMLNSCRAGVAKSVRCGCGALIARAESGAR